MKKLAISSIFVASNLVASFLIVMILVRYSATEDRAAFFLFQTIFFPMTALLAQTKILQIFRGADAASVEKLIDVGVFLLACGLLFLVGYGRYQFFEIICFALSIPITYRTVAGFAAVQRNSDSSIAWVWPMASAIGRVVMCLILIGSNTSIVFLLSAAVGLAVSMLANMKLKAKPITTQVSDKREQAFFATLFFFAVSSFAFQWDRILLGQMGKDELLVISGVCLVWVLSPVSAIFATIYRARALEIFSDTELDVKRRIFLRYTGQFVAATLGFAVILGLIWTPVNKLAFPFLDAPVILPLILVFAVMFDRIGNLRLFSFAGSGKQYRIIGIAKLATLSLGIGAVGFAGQGVSLTTIYMVYLAVSVLYCALVWKLA